MEDRRRPSAANPERIDRHQLYLSGDSIAYIIYDGDVTLANVERILAALGRPDLDMQACIIDVTKLGSVGADVRRVIGTSAAKQLLEAGSGDLVVFVVNADVVRRAVMTIIATAGRLVATRRVTTRFVDSIAAAERQAHAHCEAQRGG